MKMYRENGCWRFVFPCGCRYAWMKNHGPHLTPTRFYHCQQFSNVNFAHLNGLRAQCQQRMAIRMIAKGRKK